MSSDKKQPGKPKGPGSQVHSTEASDKREPRGKVVEAQNGEEEPRKGDPAPDSLNVKDQPTPTKKSPPGRDSEKEANKKRHTGSPDKV